MAVDDYDFAPLYPAETEAAIRARWDGWANEGITVADAERWTDVREGGYFQLSTQPGVREAARTYDLIGTEVVAAAHPLWAWESYLDDHAEVQNVVRLPATYATGDAVFAGANGTVIPIGTGVGVAPADPDADAPEFETTGAGTIAGGTVTVPIRAQLPGAQGNVAALSITAVLTPIPGVTVSNPAQTAGGADTETDDALRSRLLEVYGGESGGWNVRLYKIASRAFSAAIGRVTVIPLWNGPNTVKVVITDAAGQPLDAGTVTGLQNFLDPVAGQGHGEVTIGATVTVVTATALNIAVVAPVELEAGYSLDGFGGTVALRQALTDAIEAYVESVESGGEVVRQQVIGRIATVQGVHDVGAVTLNGSAANVAIPADPARVPVLSPAPVFSEVVL